MTATPPAASAGNRPDYLGPERLDDLARVVTELASELWVLKDRSLVLENLLEEHTGLTREQIDGHVPDPKTAALIGAERDAFASRIYGAVLPQHDRVNRELARVTR